MPRLTRQPLVALLAALAALLAPLGATAAGSVVVAARQAVAGHGTGTGTAQTTGQSPLGRLAAGRELRDTAVRRAQHEADTVLDGALVGIGSDSPGIYLGSAGQRLAGQGGVGQGPAAVLGVALLLVAAAWWVRRSAVDRAPSGRTAGIRRGRGPPAPACA